MVCIIYIIYRIILVHSVANLPRFPHRISADKRAFHNPPEQNLTPEERTTPLERATTTFFPFHISSTTPPVWVASAPRPSRSPPRSSLSATTQSSPSTSRPTSASAMKSPSLQARDCATRCVVGCLNGNQKMLVAKEHFPDSQDRLPATPPT